MSSSTSFMVGREAILLRTHEVALKKGNRRWFEQILNRNIVRLLQREFGTRVRVRQERGRLFLLEPYPADLRLVLKRCFGLAAFDAVSIVESESEAIKTKARALFSEAVKHYPQARSFRVRSKRSEKHNAIPSSLALDRELGGEIKDRHPELEVNLREADLTVRIEVRDTFTLISVRPGEAIGSFAHDLRGPGGLPVGSNARALALLSGGIDSPVAALKILRRGSPLSYLHFFGTPFVADSVLDKIRDLVAVLNQYQPYTSPLRVVPFGKIQERIALATQPKLRTILFRRMMVRIACRVAENTRSLALVTGESLGQVASQTLENIRTIDAVSTLPILRPLIGFDKEEIVRMAEQNGTFSISVRPEIDCCTLFADRHPLLRSDPEEIEAEERKFPFQEFVEEALAQLRVIKP